MDAFTVQCAQRGATLGFFDREPEDASRPIDHFSIRVTNTNLDATARVYAPDPYCYSLGCLFREIAAEWRGWDGFKTWQSLEGELKVNCANDRRGHITIAVELRSGFYDLDWHVKTAVLTEAGQLDLFARHARKFFGACE
jgi:hypothetical protein